MLAEIEPWFAHDYRTARGLFLKAAEQNGLSVQSIVHPLRGPEGDELATDAVRIGPHDADKLLVLTSGMHGVELYCGSMCQAALIASGYFSSLPDGMAVLLVHAINPWGSAHGRRVNENNVDPCRNFLDFTRPLPGNADYPRLHPHLADADRPGEAGDSARAVLTALRAEWGDARFNAAQFGGQYAYPDGVFYGGQSAEWTNRTISGLLREHGGPARRVATLDYHSGIGPWGELLGVVVHTGEGLARARRWYGDAVLAPNDPDQDDPGYYPVTGHSSDGYEAALPSVEVTAVVLEFGTYPLDRGSEALGQEHWLNSNNGDCDPAEARAIKAALARHFNPDDAEWRATVWDKSRHAIRQAIAGLVED
ncbi:M14 family metallopeptidase [Novosphingobium sp.]|jgi:hypothetical protein|uniref:M14 family metallopeptidase n=1 Tax=Novosphingobium sp. TaxID=1874826 RepID=UPI0022CA8F29|nr:M14 family metallopeptidase [Novosphingobium sp.]MCZ8018509.1 M14 family metallopeptidase [Novosphingobium sp.]MCZ8033503.1 M14 family metallopeptidase [Novosphingobium sp.]MCZ8051958.1 M14 family metallopeptidase [Novosphingobium sp.]MCZ8060500.1 M14 family metallopeptidase [Novosphingobium sp.]MCZ8232142.1 M14 family metallopeptidase [Novosphingobium sp.]